jgi:LysM repeat protein
MRARTVLIPLVAALTVAAPPAASADFLHVVAPGESLTSIAATDGLSVGQLASANGISPDTQLVAGSTLGIPPQTTSAVAAPASAATTASAASGSYVVQPGDTLSAIAARAGMSVDGLAALNGLDPNGYLLSGAVLQLGGGSSAAGSGSAAASQPVGPAAEGSAGAPPYPTPERLSASQVGSIAAANGVPASLADAIGWQESGFNNALTSSAGAVGVMQILPGTWQWINSSLTPSPLAPSSASDNVRGGSLMLHSLLSATGGNEAMAAAGYYQGLSSVEQNGMYADTQQYVNDVMALAQQFGGG